MPEGYKDSPLGVIPQEWEVKRLGDLVDPNRKISYGIVQTGELISNGIPCIRVVDLVEGRIDKKQLITTSEEISHSYRKTIVKNGDIVIALRGKVGESVLITDDLAGCNLTRGVALISNHPNIFSRFLIQLINSPLMKVEFEKKMNGSALQEIPINVLRSIETVVPPLEVQRRIAEVLGCWDEAIERQGGKVALLQSRKRALMQQLLTPHRRLPNFSEPWKTTKLGEIAERVTRKNTENNLNVMTISAQRGFVSQTDFFNKSIASEITDNYFLVHQDEFCYNKSYCNGYPMGAIKRLNNAEKAVVTTLYICFRIKCDKCDIEFLEQYFEAGFLNKNLMKIANEGGRAHGLLNVTPSDFFAMSFEVPSLDEQRAIAEVLTTADREIELATQNLTALRSQKRALMQQLLTGKKRLKYDI